MIASNMYLYRDFVEEVQRGKRGENKGLTMGLPAMEYDLGGIQKKRYDVVFGSEGSGKSAFILNSYIMHPYEQALRFGVQHKLKIRYYSLEMDAISVMARLTTWKVQHECGVICTVGQLRSRGAHKVSRYLQEKVSSLQPYFDQLFDETLTIIDQPMSPEDIRNDIVHFAKSRGHYEERYGRKIYVPDNPDEHVIIIVDTVTNLKLQQQGNRLDKKGTIDLHSEYSRDIYRNQFYYSVVNAMHSGRQVVDINRMRFDEAFPRKEDIFFSSQPSQDANVVIALFNPHVYMNDNNGLKKFMNYQIDRGRGRIVIAGLLKNRDGQPGVRKGLLFTGECSSFSELPHSSKMTEDHYKAIETIGISDITTEAPASAQHISDATDNQPAQSSEQAPAVDRSNVTQFSQGPSDLMRIAIEKRAFKS